MVAMPALLLAAHVELSIIPAEKPLLISHCIPVYFVLKANASIGVVKKTRYVSVFLQPHIPQFHFGEHIYERRYKVQKQGVFIIGF